MNNKRIRIITGHYGSCLLYTSDVYKRQTLVFSCQHSVGHSRETARDNLEEGGDDVKSSCPL